MDKELEAQLRKFEELSREGLQDICVRHKISMGASLELLLNLEDALNMLRSVAELLVREKEPGAQSETPLNSPLKP